jgi:hypothetical protein
VPSRLDPAQAPEQRQVGDLYAGTARFDAAGNLLTYVGRGAAGEKRFLALQERWKGEKVTGETVRASLEGAGATYVDSPPTLKTSRPLRVIHEAIGRSVRSTATPDRLSFDALSPADLVRTQLAWTIEMIVVRGEGEKRYFVTIDPWGEVLTVGRYGEAWP